MFRKVVLWLGIVIVAILSLPFLLIAKLLNNKRISLKLIHWVCKPINWIAGNHIHIEGLSNLTDNDNYVLIANHLSFFDILSLMSFIDKPVVFVAKQELSKIPIASWWFNTQDTLYLNRDDVNSGLNVIKEVINYMKNDENIGIFPAGTRSVKQLPFKPSIIKLAQKYHKTIIPLTIKNTNLVLEDRKTNGHVDTYFTFHKPLVYDEYQDLNLDTLTKLLEDIVYMKEHDAS